MRIFCTQLVTPSSGYCPVFQVDLAALKQAGGSGSTGTGTDAASSVKRRNSTTTNGHSRKSSSVQVIKQTSSTTIQSYFDFNSVNFAKKESKLKTAILFRAGTALVMVMRVRTPHPFPH